MTTRAQRKRAYREKPVYQAGRKLGLRDRRSGAEAKSNWWLDEETQRQFPGAGRLDEIAFTHGYNFEYFKGPKSNPSFKIPVGKFIPARLNPDGSVTFKVYPKKRKPVTRKKKTSARKRPAKKRATKRKR
jgi:hypothetical protein